MINRNTISNILKKPYDKVLFAKDILKPVFQNFQLRTEAIEANIELTQTEQKAISKVFIYGSITLSDDTEIICYEIILQPSVHIEQNKVTIQQYVRKLLITGQAALINFISPVNEAIWRFTLVAKDSVFTEEGVKETATHPKRYTYLIETGLNKNNRTLAERLEVLSSTQDQNLQSLINAFSVETLSKAFFDEYKAHYNKFIQYLNTSNFFISIFKTNDKTVRDFTKKLLGRLVFLYFVQRKGWLGASNDKYKDGDHNFLSNLFIQSGCNEGFYTIWLKTLFFDTLNNPLKKGDFKMPDGTMVKIPFLNGGLFDKDDIDNYDFTIPADLFHNETQSELPLKRGFFDFLNAFNFTIYEDSPDDHTVAVDPEMLGHIFENLLEDNKDKGAFYTPKQIVHYMCQESLIQYLITNYEPGNDDKNKNSIENLIRNKHLDNHLNFGIINDLLDKVKICDPAIGSGAFPIGLLHEIFSLKEIIADHFGKELNRAEAKENIIQNSIYGVDIEKGAVDIARLRFWLSLVVDEDHPKPLPNLDYKIVVGNSLLSKFEDEVLAIDWSSDTTKVGVFAQEFAFERIRLLNEISTKQKEYFHSEKADKNDLSIEIRNFKIDLLITQLKLMIKSKGIDTIQSNAKGNALKQQTELMLQTQAWKNAIKKLENIKNQKNFSLQYFDWILDFPEVMNSQINKQAGFDIVIGNPPYIAFQRMSIDMKNGLLNQNYQTFENTGDIYTLFYEKGYKLLKEKGVLSFITSRQWLQAAYGKSLRKYLATQTNPVQLIDFGQCKLFKEATVFVNILLTQKNTNQNNLAACLIPIGFDVEKELVSTYFSRSKQIIQSLSENTWAISNLEDIKKQIFKIGIPLNNKEWKQYIEFYRGVTTGLNEAFHIDEKTKDLLLKDKKNNEIIKPLLRGKDIKRYTYDFSNIYLIETLPSKDIKIENYPLIEKHLEQFRKQLEPKPLHFEGNWQGRKPGRYKWFQNQDDTAYWPKFLKPKIVWIEISDRANYAYDEKGMYLTNSAYFLTCKSDNYDLKYILAILNSKVADFIFSQKTARIAGGRMRYTKQYVGEIPVPQISLDEQKPFIKLADYILFLKEQKLIDSTDKMMPFYFEHIIDVAVYELFFKEEVKRAKFEIISYINNIPEINSKTKLEDVRNIYKELNSINHPIRFAVSLLKNYEPFKTIEETLNRKDQ